MIKRFVTWLKSWKCATGQTSKDNKPTLRHRISLVETANMARNHHASCLLVGYSSQNITTYTTMMTKTSINHTSPQKTKRNASKWVFTSVPVFWHCWSSLTTKVCLKSYHESVKLCSNESRSTTQKNKKKSKSCQPVRHPRILNQH